MRTVLIFASALVATPVLAQDARPAAYTNAEACLRQNAPVAVRTNESAADAADFLLTYLCAGPVAAAGAYERNSSALASMKAMMAGMDEMAASGWAAVTGADVADADAVAAAGADDPAAQTSPDNGGVEPEASPFAIWNSLEGASVDPVTGEIIVTGPNAGMMANALQAQAGAMAQMFGDSAPVFLRELAGRLVVEGRR